MEIKKLEGNLGSKDQAEVDTAFFGRINQIIDWITEHEKEHNKDLELITKTYFDE